MWAGLAAFSVISVLVSLAKHTLILGGDAFTTVLMRTRWRPACLSALTVSMTTKCTEVEHAISVVEWGTDSAVKMYYRRLCCRSRSSACARGVNHGISRGIDAKNGGSGRTGGDRLSLTLIGMPFARRSTKELKAACTITAKK